MRVIAHISDLHFGAADPVLVDAVREELRALQPHLVAVSGDLTQRARRWQFREAREFLETLPRPQLVVPGNHDVPLYDVLRRFGRPLGRFRHFITPDLAPVSRHEEVLVLGANTTRSFTIKDGGLRDGDLAPLVAALGDTPPTAVRVLVCHHPFDAPAGAAGRLTRPRPARGALAALVAAGLDVVLTGHLHLSYTGHTAARYHTAGRTAIVVEGGTATSTRVRGVPNAFNVLRLTGDRVEVEQRAWDASAARFGTACRDTFVRVEAGWASTA